MKTIKLETAFFSNKHTETPFYTVLSFQVSDVARLIYLQDLAAKEDITIRWDFTEDDFLDEEDQPMKWRSDFSCIQIYANGAMYFYAQNKWDAGDQIETEAFDLNLINKTV